MTVEYNHATTPVSLFLQMCTSECGDERARAFNDFWIHPAISAMVRSCCNRWCRFADPDDLRQSLYIILRQQVENSKITLPPQILRMGWICQILKRIVAKCAKKNPRNIGQAQRTEEQCEPAEPSRINLYLLLFDNERQRSVIRMRYQEGMTFEAIGKELDLSTATVHRDHGLACDALRDWLLLLSELGVLNSPALGFSKT